MSYLTLLLLLSLFPILRSSREGNIINGLDSSNPTRLLLDAIRLAGINKSFKNSEEFLLGIVSPTGEVQIFFVSWERKPTCSNFAPS